MASPNLISANLILGKTTGMMLSNTAFSNVLNNAASSGKTFKVNTLNLTNRSGNTTAATITWYANASLSGTTNVDIVSNVNIPAQSTLTVIDKGTQYYLEENTSLGGITTSNGTVFVTVSYEDIS